MTWLDILRAECQRTSQHATARLLGLSKSTVCLVLANKYPASTAAIEALVRERLGSREDWRAALRAEVSRTSQVRTAARLNISEATVSQVLSDKYAASTLRIERRVRGTLLGETCECPVLMSPPLHICQDVQERKAGQFGNPIYAQAWLACRGLGRFESRGPCPHFNVGSKPPQNQAPNPTPTETPAPKEAA